MDGHSIMIDDYLEMRPERRSQIEKFVKEGRLIIGPYYTLPEEFTISHEALVRNLMFGRETVEKYGGKCGTVAYTPSSWGQTGQYPQILKDFGINYMMFYRGISHDEAPAEYIWKAPDGTAVTASRFALYCRYNWYYQVHRAVSRNRVWTKDYKWGEFDEAPFRRADGFVGPSINYDLKSPVANYEKENLKKAILDMLEEEKGHFTTPVFLGMNGHDISVAFPRESEVIKDAKEIFKGQIDIEHTNLEGFWKDAEKYMDKDKMTVLTGERRSYLKEGKWTYLFPGTISARTYLKQADFNAYTALSYVAEPLNAIAGNDSKGYLHRGWQFLISNHSHDANGGCAPDCVCKDMEYRFRKAQDIAEIVADDAMVEIAKNLSPDGQDKDVVQLVVYNTLPYKRDVIVPLDIEVPDTLGKGISIDGVKLQSIVSEKSSIFVDSIWEVPTILDSMHHRLYAQIKDVPAMGYKTLEIKPNPHTLQKRPGIALGNVLENSKIKATVNPNGTIDVLYKETGKEYKGLNYYTSQGEVGNAWAHKSPEFDRKYSTIGTNAKIYVTESGELSGTIVTECEFSIPESCAVNPSDIYTSVPIKTSYTLDADADYIKVNVEVVNNAKDHWLRVNFPTGIETDVSITDSHFDVLKHDIAIPDSTGWVEQAFGTLKIVNKQNGQVYDNMHYFEDTGEVGDYWINIRPNNNRKYNTIALPAKVWLENNGDLSATLGIETKMELPEEGIRPGDFFAAGSKRSDKNKTMVITSYITLKKDAKKVDVRVEIDNNICDHRVRAAYPTGIQADYSYAHGHFTVDKRPIVKAADGEYEPDMQTLPMQTFVDITDNKTGMAFINNSLTEFEAKEDGTVYLTMFRSVKNNICTERRVTSYYTEQHGGECLGKRVCEYAIYPHDGKWDDADVMKEAEKFNIPATVMQLSGGSDGDVKPNTGMINIESDKLVMSGFKKAEDRNSVIMRIYNPTENEVISKISTLKMPKKAYTVNLNEERTGELDFNKPITFGKYKIMTFELEF